MTHDPLCPISKYPNNYPRCACDLISKVREDAIAAAVQRVEAIADDMESGVDWNWDYDIDPTGMTRNPRVWIREAVAAIKGDSDD